MVSKLFPVGLEPTYAYVDVQRAYRLQCRMLWSRHEDCIKLTIHSFILPHASPPACLMARLVLPGDEARQGLFAHRDQHPTGHCLPEQIVRLRIMPPMVPAPSDQSVSQSVLCNRILW